MLACALPNFAALAPAPTASPDAMTFEPNDNQHTEPTALPSISAPPPQPNSVQSLPPVQIPTAESAPFTTLQAGITYLINQVTELRYQPIGLRPVVIRVSDGGQLDILDHNDQPIVNAQRLPVGTETLYLLTTPPSELKIKPQGAV